MEGRETSADQHVDNIDPQIMEMALLDLPNIERVLQLRAPIETLQGAKALKVAYQIWMEEMRVHHDDPRAWEFQQNSQVCDCEAAHNVSRGLSPCASIKTLCLAGILGSLVRICRIC